MAQNDTYRFGVEVELLLESPNKRHSTWASLAEDLSKLLAKAGVPNQVHGTNDYSQWTIVREVTVQDPDGKNPYQYGVELVSPIHASKALSTLRESLTTIFAVLNRNNLTIIPTPRSSSHIHISRTPSPFSPTDLAALAKAVLYFEHALNALMPADRNGKSNITATPTPASNGTSNTTTVAATHWSKSLRSPDNPALSGLSLPACLTKIDAAAAASNSDNNNTNADTRPIISLLNLCSPTTKWALTHGRSTPFIRGKTYKWDFTGLLPPFPASSPQNGDGTDADAERGIQGTIEFRQPPGSVCAEEAVRWVVLGVAFVAGAVVVGGRLGGEGVMEEGGSVGELCGLLEVGRGVLGWEDLGGSEGLFEAVN